MVPPGETRSKERPSEVTAHQIYRSIGFADGGDRVGAGVVHARPGPQSVQCGVIVDVRQRDHRRAVCDRDLYGQMSDPPEARC